MILVVFELEPRSDAVSRYFDLAASLADELKSIDGFISVERFQSVTRPGRYLSLSVWRDEAAVKAWRAHAGHRQAQQAGRQQIFSDYRLRVATVVRDYGLLERGRAPSEPARSIDPGPE